MTDQWAEQQANRQFEGPVDSYGRPKISNEKLDIEVHFPEKDQNKAGEPTSILYRWYYEHTGNQSYCGRWCASRSEAYEQGQQWVKQGRL